MIELSNQQVENIRQWRNQRLAETEPRPTDRMESERDADRLVYASSFARLQGVVQVASAPRRIVFHNRYTHSVKVSRLGLRIAQRLVRRAEIAYDSKAEGFLAHLGGLDPNVVEAAGLAHDLGHPPFGHHGETVLDALIGPAGFNGNAQTFRVVTRLAVRDLQVRGLNLTRASLLGLLKYPWPRSQEKGRDRAWGYYASESSLVGQLREGRPAGLHPLVMTGAAPSLEASIMDWADDITYAVHDVEDFFRAGLIPLRSLRSPDAWDDVIAQGRQRAGSALASVPESDLHAAAKAVTARLDALLIGLDSPYDGSRALESHLTLLASQLIGLYVAAARLQVPDELHPSGLAVDPELQCQVLLLKELAWYYVINRPGLAGIQYGQAKTLGDLYRLMLKSIQILRGGAPSTASFDGDPRLVPLWARSWAEEKEVSNEEVARDIVASLDEDTVHDLTLRYAGIEPGSVSDSII